MDAAASAAAAAAAADAANNPEKRRRRPPLACVACRRRKVRCDRKMPCQNCVRARRATGCTYVPDDRLEPRDGTQGFYDGINGRSNGRDDVVSAPLSTYLPENNNNNNNSSPASGAGSCAATAGTATPSGGGGGGGGAGGHHGPQQQHQQQHHRHHSHNQQQQPPLPPHEGGAPGQPVSASALADRVRQLEQQLAQVLDARTSGAAGAAGAAKSSAPSAQFLHAHPPAAGAQYLGEEHWKINDGAQTAHYMNSNPAGMASSQAMLAKSRYLGASHWMHGVTLVGRLLSSSLADPIRWKICLYVRSKSFSLPASLVIPRAARVRKAGEWRIEPLPRPPPFDHEISPYFFAREALSSI